MRDCQSRGILRRGEGESKPNDHVQRNSGKSDPALGNDMMEGSKLLLPAVQGPRAPAFRCSLALQRAAAASSGRGDAIRASLSSSPPRNPLRRLLSSLDLRALVSSLLPTLSLSTLLSFHFLSLLSVQPRLFPHTTMSTRKRKQDAEEPEELVELPEDGSDEEEEE